MIAVTPIRAKQDLTALPGNKTGGPGIAASGTSSAGRFRGARPAPLRPVDEAAEVRAITRGTIQASMEVLAGIRPVHQLARRLDPRCLSALQHRAALIRRELTRTGNPALARLHRNSVVRSVRVCEVSDGIYEASAVVVDDVRARAVAVRIERSKQVWRVVELVIG
ncbi:Rv3235 family protein [Arthrobacter sp. 135MFCol5.1]|uniref:Rv3235 family protein n=1 Tax=Arthrobacter sp. 135MFCol5.1 TaxID=1158050 RepID=UPI00037F6190|nr:Rv3235 family protein [Arthrobacter sp. 135MFCol5.1]